MDDHGLDDLVHQELAFAVIGGVPDGVGIDRAQKDGDLLELTREAVGHEPTVEEVTDWWNMARRSAFREQAAFRTAFPTLESPALIYSTPESREGVARHAAAGDKVERWILERRNRKEADSVNAFMFPAEPTV